MSTKINVEGRRLVKNDKIAEIGQGGGGSYTAGDGIDITNDVISVDNTVALKSDLPDAVSGTNDGTNWTSITIGDTTKAIPQGGGSGSDCPIVTWLDPTKVKTYCPSNAATQTDWTNFYLSLPVVIGRKGSTYATNQLVNLGWNANQIFVTEHGQSLQIMGYFLMTVETNSSSNQVQQLVLVNNSSGASSIVGNTDPSAKAADKITNIFHSNNTRLVMNGVQYRGENTYYENSTIVDPLGNHIRMIVIDPSPERFVEYSCKPGENIVYNQWIPVGIVAPVGSSNGNPNSLLINATDRADGKYQALATVTSGVVTAFSFEEALPLAPTTAGTYVLKATVDALGHATYT